MKPVTYISLLEVEKPEKACKERGSTVKERVSFAFQVVPIKAIGEIDGRM